MDTNDIIFLMFISSLVGILLGFCIWEIVWRSNIKKAATVNEDIHVGDCKFIIIPSNKIAAAKCSPDEDI